MSNLSTVILVLVQHILKPGGRAAVVLPDELKGILAQSLGRNE